MTLRGSSTPLCDAYDAGLLDLDGVVYLGPVAIPGAATAIEQARARGMKLAFVTNNASRRAEAVAEALTGLGIPARPTDVVTSPQAVVRILRERIAADAGVLVVGADGLRHVVATAGYRVVTSADERPAAVVQGLNPDLTYADLVEAVLAVAAGALWVASNTDTTLPTTRGLLPGNGALVAAVRAATGQRPIVAGKPAPALHRESVERVGALHPLIVGDRLDTDIEGAVNGGADSLLVLSGVTGADQLIAAGPQHRPTYVDGT